MSHSGRVGRRRAKLYRDDADRLLLSWGDLTTDLAEVVVRHRDDDGRVAFWLARPGSGEVLKGVRYPLRGPRPWNLLTDATDFTADEPWTWEDADFGLLVFHAATDTGPVKYRHRIEAKREESFDLAERRSLTVDDERVVRARAGGRTEVVEFSELSEVRVKFELSGIWSDAALLTLDSPQDLAVVPLGSTDKVAHCLEQLLPRLRLLPGWDASADEAFRDACEYGLRDAVGPTPDESASSRAERPVWSRPPGT